MFHKLKLEKKEQKIFGGLFILSLFYILPIILADRFFVDDLGRNYLGYYWWDHNGRLLANGIMKVLSDFHPTVMDFSPLTLILGIACLSLSLVLFSKKYFSHYASKLQIGMLFFTLVSPFLIENLAFKYDSMLMLIGLSFVFLCFSLSKELSRGLYYVITSLLVLGMLFLYQAELGAYLCLVLFECIVGIISDERTGKLIKQGLSRVIQALILSFVYQKSVAAYIASSPYSRSHASLVSLNKEGIKTVIYNFKEYQKIINSYVTSHKLLVIITFLGCACALLILLKNFYERSHRNILLKIVDTLIMIVSPFLLLILSLSILIVLKTPVFSCRTMISMTVIYLMIGITLAYLIRHVRFTQILMIFCLLMSFTFIYSYGNLSKSQRVHEDNITQSIVYDLRHLERDHKVQNISLSGSYTYSRQIDRADPFYIRLIPKYYENNSLWGGYLIQNASDQTVKFKLTNAQDIAYIRQARPDVENQMYAIYIYQEKAIIYFYHGSHSV